MIDILLTLIIFAVLGYHAWSEKGHAKEKKELIDALIAKSAQDLRDLRIAENTNIKVDNKQTMPDMIPLENIDDEGFINAINNTYDK